MFACKVEHYCIMTAKFKFAPKTAENWTIISYLTAKWDVLLQQHYNFVDKK